MVLESYQAICFPEIDGPKLIPSMSFLMKHEHEIMHKLYYVRVVPNQISHRLYDFNNDSIDFAVDLGYLFQ